MLELLEDRVALSFAAAVPYTIGTQPDGFVPNAAPQSIATGLFTSNGVTDMVIAHTSDDSVYFLRGNGNGTFQPAVKIATFTKPMDGDVFAADFNGDGKLDLFVPTLQVSGGVPSDSYPIILLGNGDGTFQAPIYTSQDFLPASQQGKSYVRGWAVADFNGDGKQDLVGNVVAGGVTVMLGNGDGTFQNPIYTPVTMGYSRWLTAGDVNGDGKADVIIADGNGVNNQTGNSEITVLLGNGDGTFQLEGHYAAPPTPDGGFDGNGAGDVVNPEDVMVADLNHDGKLDVVESLYDHSIDVFMGNGDGSFQPAIGYYTGEYPRAVAAADVNGDGKMDLVVDNVGVGPGGAIYSEEGDVTGTIAVLYGNGDGTFQAPIQYSSIYYPGWVAVGDFNGDGMPDVAATQVSNGNSVNVLLNQSAAGAPTLINPAGAAGSLPDEPSTIFTNTAAGTTIALSVLAADPGPDAGPTYTWSVAGKPSGAANPTFSVNNSGAADNTVAAFSQAGLYTFNVLITDPSSGKSITSSVQVLIVVNQAPTVTTAAAASPSPVNGTTTTLSVLPADDGGSANLTFTWAAMGAPPAPVSFSPISVVSPTGIGVNFLTTATFSKAGAYSLQVTITDPEGRSVVSAVNVTVNQTLTSILVTPTPIKVVDGGTQQFTASALDQFGNPMAAQPIFTWTSTGLGSVNSSGLYSAPSSGAGSATVKAKSGSVSGAAVVTVTAGQPPAVSLGGSATDTLQLFATGPNKGYYSINGNAIIPYTNINAINVTGFGMETIDAGGGVVRTVRNGSGVILTLAGPVTISIAGSGPLQINNADAVDAIPGPDTADRSSAFIGLSADERFVQALYLTDLGRVGAKSELDAWVAFLNSANGGQAAVANGIGNAEESLDRQVQGWYHAYLGRPAAGGEELGWVGLLQSGQTQEQVLSKILSTQEFFNDAQRLIGGANANQNYVEALYLDLLDRNGDSGGVAGWVNALPTVGRQSAALSFLQSQEFRYCDIEGYYNLLLHRPADPTGLSNWVFSNLDVASVGLSFESGREFYNNG